MKPYLLAIVSALGLTSAISTLWAETSATLRGDTPVVLEGKAPRMPKVSNEDIKRGRAYPMQPPVIPHKTDNYQVDRRANKCLSCHSRKRTEESQAPMISVTHYMDREGNFLADVSPRRYFCNQCHVTQMDVKDAVENTFVDIDTLLKKSALLKKNKP